MLPAHVCVRMVIVFAAVRWARSKGSKAATKTEKTPLKEDDNAAARASYYN